MIAGIAMGIQQNFVLAPAHAHLNLVGGVLLFLFGLYYRMDDPAAGRTTLARIQGWLHIFGGILLPAGIALVIVGAQPIKRRPSLVRLSWCWLWRCLWLSYSATGRPDRSSFP